MNKTLILTGWSKTVYMTAAAAALETLKWNAEYLKSRNYAS